MNLLEKLMNIQSELQAPKNQFNRFGKYNYRNCEDILEALKPYLKKYNCVVTLNDELIIIGDRYYVKAIATIKDTESEATESTTAFAREEETKKGMDGSQVTGASSSYARKYALNGLFAIDDNKDSDTTNTNNKDKKVTEIKLSEAQIKRAYALGYKAGYDKANVDKQILTKFNKKIQDLTKEEYELVCNGYEKLGGK
ncbi:ERF family protein [uncultured Clostridium sp.]|uniref:ERF family protein n=1 Tax=uncultured Clostridium sp. TaxID=59620 RepID=UPI00280AE680|nr:ERF family protein [uncultured Clostridium sp.]